MKYSIAVYIISIQTSNSFSHYLKTVIYFIQSTVSFTGQFTGASGRYSLQWQTTLPKRVADWTDDIDP